MRRDIIINSGIVAYLNGISAMSWWFGMSLPAVLMPMVLVWMVWWWGALWRSRGLLLLLVLCFFFGVMRMVMIVEQRDWRGDVGIDDVRVEGVVSALPQVKQGRVEVVLEEVRFNGAVQGEGLVMVKLPMMTLVQPGSLIKMKADLVGSNDAKWVESYKQYLGRQKIRWVSDKPSHVVIVADVERNLVNWFWLILWQMRQWLMWVVESALREPAASLVMGVLIGERGSLPIALAANFQITGLTHLLAISGFNITLIINLMLWLVRKNSKIIRWGICLLVITGFVCLTGASASVLRAAVMGVLALSVMTWGRRAQVLKILLMSVALIVTLDPMILNFDLSFQLSVLATLSLVWFADSGKWQNWQLSWQQWVWDALWLTIAAQILTLPLMFFHFGKISIIAPLANLLIGPLIPVLMLLGGVLIVMQIFLPWGGVLLAGIIEMLVWLMRFLIDSLAGWPGAQIEVPAGDWWWVISYYLLLIIFFRKRKLAPD